MHKHRGFPSRLPSSDFQFTIRRENKSGATELRARERYRDRKAPDRRADAIFLACLIDFFGDQPFLRGNLDAGRLSWLFEREVKPVEPFDPCDYDAELYVDMQAVETGFPDLQKYTAELG